MTRTATEGAVKVRIADTLRDPAYQVRRRLDGGTIAKYAQAYRSEAPMPPVRVMRLPGGTLILTDGWHRVAALESLGQATVEAVIVDGTEREALWEAARANLVHGLPLKAREHRRVFQAYVKAGQYKLPSRRTKGALKSYRQIAADLGGVVSHVSVRRWMQQDFPRLAAKMAAADQEGPPGGLQDERGEDPETKLASIARDSLRAALVAARGVLEPGLRGTLVETLREALSEIESAHPFVINEDF